MRCSYDRGPVERSVRRRRIRRSPSYYVLVLITQFVVESQAGPGFFDAALVNGAFVPCTFASSVPVVRALYTAEFLGPAAPLLDEVAEARAPPA